jgi:SAM-dependent methyltransferase
MRIVVVLSLVLLLSSSFVCSLAGCAPVPGPASPPCAPEPRVMSDVAASLPSEASVRKWSHDLLEAYDRGDVAAVDATLASGFILFEASVPTSREAELAHLAKRKRGSPHIEKRSWSNEHVFVRVDSALFIGEAAEHMGGNDSHGGNDFRGWYTLVWSREGGAWKVSLWTWQKGGVSAQRDTWNEIYRAKTGFTKEPNRLLVDTVQGVKSGAALDVAMGQGRNAIYLASRGWKVTGIDFSDEGVRIARATATEQKLALDAVNVDIDTYDFGVAKWDLVTMIYALDKVEWIEKIKPSIKPGGLFVLEYFHKEGPTGDGFATGQLAGLFKDGFDIVRDEVVEGTPDWAMDHGTVVRFVAKKR